MWLSSPFPMHVLRALNCHKQLVNHLSQNGIYSQVSEGW